MLQAACQNNGIPVEEEISHVIEGWEGKPKVMLQVLWGRGFINTENGLKKAYLSYSIKGFNDQFRNRCLKTSLKEMISCCHVFEEEETMLQLIAQNWVSALIGHPNVTANLQGRALSMPGHAPKISINLFCWKKRGKENFMKSVRMCISRDILTRERSQKFVRRARRYIMGYHVLHQMQHNDVQGNRMTSSSKDLAIVPVKLEQMVKNSRHTGVLLTSITPFARKYSKRQHQHHEYLAFFNICIAYIIIIITRLLRSL